jgi:hypothetical protein
MKRCSWGHLGQNCLTPTAATFCFKHRRTLDIWIEDARQVVRVIDLRVGSNG